MSPAVCGWFVLREGHERLYSCTYLFTACAARSKLFLIAGHTVVFVFVRNEGLWADRLTTAVTDETALVPRRACILQLPCAWQTETWQVEVLMMDGVNLIIFCRIVIFLFMYIFILKLFYRPMPKYMELCKELFSVHKIYFKPRGRQPFSYCWSFFDWLVSSGMVQWLVCVSHFVLYCEQVSNI